MSTEIVALFSFGESFTMGAPPPNPRAQGCPPPDELLCRIARTFSGWPQASGELRGLKVSRSDRHTVVDRREDTLTADALCRAAAGRREPTDMLSTTSSFRCFRFHEGRPEAGSVGVWLEAWGDAWTRENHEDRRIGGEAGLSVADCGPFCARLEISKDARRDEINARVEENLDAFTGLLFRLIEALEPRSVKVFSAQGLYLPMNAHLLYLRDASVVLDDLALIADVWERGLPRHRIAPLRSCPPEDLSAAFHGWRTPEQREALRGRFDALLPRRQALSTGDVEKVLASGRFDTFTMPVGLTVLDFPHFMNAFLDRLYLEVLAAAGS
jgi:hypothetical protein